MKYNAILLSDFYKQVHAEQYNKDINKLVSYYTPRMSRINGDDFVICFGVQGFIKAYLIEYFNDNFFNRSLNDVIYEYDRFIKYTLGEDITNHDKIISLHNLGYLPIKIKCIKEGTKVGIKVPMIEISNTNNNFPWVTNVIESLMSCSLWYPMVIANVGYKYRKIVDYWYDKTVDNNIPHSSAISEFGLRGAESLESGIKASAAFLLSFTKTATCPAIMYLEHYYNSNIETDNIGQGMASTEHSVMCSNYSIDGDEEKFLKKLITEIYKNGNISIVCDSYDYWNVVDNILPKFKDDILKRNGTVFVRGDSGDPVKIVTDTVKHLWNIFGGYINSKGYKVLNNHIRAIYGDSITPNRAKKIYEILESDGFACNNVALGAGSFSLQCNESFDDNGNQKLDPFTRDTYGVAVKSTYCEINGKPIHIFKNPKTDTEHFKKSQKGCCIVYHNGTEYIDELNYDDTENNNQIKNEMECIFENGHMIKEYTLNDIRQTLYDQKF